MATATIHDDHHDTTVRECLGALVTGGLVEYQPAEQRYVFPPEHALVLTGDGSTNVAPLSRIPTLLAHHLDEAEFVFRHGGGIPYERFRPEFTAVLDVGRAEASDGNLPNVRFEHLDILELPDDPPYDAVVGFDVIHDQADPSGVLRRVQRALIPGGVFLMMGIKAASRLEQNLDNPFAPFLYTVSTLHCMTVSLARSGAGLGTVWGEQRARDMLVEAGFVDITVHDVPDDPLNQIYIARSATSWPARRVVTICDGIAHLHTSDLLGRARRSQRSDPGPRGRLGPLALAVPSFGEHSPGHSKRRRRSAGRDSGPGPRRRHGVAPTLRSTRSFTAELDTRERPA